MWEEREGGKEAAQDLMASGRTTACPGVPGSAGGGGGFLVAPDGSGDLGPGPPCVEGMQTAPWFPSS